VDGHFAWPDPIDSITAELVGGVTAVGGYVNLDLTGGVRLAVFDVADNHIGSPDFDDFVLDDFHFGAAAVSEPATVGLVLLGLAGMSSWRRSVRLTVG
jgi:hypothetical protein